MNRGDEPISEAMVSIDNSDNRQVERIEKAMQTLTTQTENFINTNTTVSETDVGVIRDIHRQKELQIKELTESNKRLVKRVSVLEEMRRNDSGGYQDVNA